VIIALNLRTRASPALCNALSLKCIDGLILAARVVNIEFVAKRQRPLPYLNFKRHLYIDVEPQKRDWLEIVILLYTLRGESVIFNAHGLQASQSNKLHRACVSWDTCVFSDIVQSGIWFVGMVSAACPWK